MAIVNGYCDVDALKARLQDETALDDAVYEANIEAASRLIDGVSNRRFWKDTSDTSRTYAATNWSRLAIDDLVSLTSLKTDEDGDGTFETTWDADDYELVRPDFPGLDPAQVPYTRIEAVGSRAFPVACSGRRRRVQVTGIFGWPSIPPDVTEACLLTAARLFKRRYGPEGVAGFGQFGEVPISDRIDPDATLLIRRYVRDAVLVA